MTPLAHRATTALTSALLASAGLVATGVAPAHAAPAAVDDVSLTWGINGYAQGGVFGPWRLFGPTGGASVLSGSVSGGSQAQYAVAPVPTTSMPASTPQRTPNAVRFSGGTGTADATTGAMSVAWTGSYTVNAYPTAYDAPDETYSDPRLEVDADGSGSLTMQVEIGAGIDIEGNPSPARDLGRLTVLDFSDGSSVATGAEVFRLTPDYQGVVLGTAGSTPQRTDCSTAAGATGWWGSWPTGLVDALPESVRPHFYSTGCGGLQDTKPPLPVDVDLDPSQVGSTTTVTAPARRFGQDASVSVKVSSAGATSGTVTLTGLGAARTAPVTDGTAVFRVARPAVRAHRLTATYSGTSGTLGSTATATLRVTKAASSTAVTVIKPTTRKAGTVTVTVASPTTTPAGKVRVVVKKGNRTVRTVTKALKARRATLPLPRGAKGAYKAVVTYLGNAGTATSARTASYTITR